MNIKDSKQFPLTNITKDIIAGIVVAFVSIPISMGYAQIAGLPPVYGLYGAFLPIILFGLISSSKQFVVGVDAMPAAMVGALLAQLGIIAESKEALLTVPVITFLTAAWLMIFFFLKAGRIVKYISMPVMGGFISGVGLTIILMQVSKLFGGASGSGEIFSLIPHIANQLSKFHLLSAVLGFSTVVIILISKKYIPKFAMPIVMMVAGALLTVFFHVDEKGVALLPQVSSGLPKIYFPDVSIIGNNYSDFIIESLTIALVIMAQSLLTTGNYAIKHGYKVDNNLEILGYCAANIGSFLVGSCPINGSVSRTGIADQFECKSQWMSIASGFTILMVLLFGTQYLHYLPVPVLTGIVMAALIGIIDFKMIRRLWKENRNELFIFMMAFGGVLVFGTIYGVLIGVLLSFGEVVVRAVIPPRAFEGRIPGHSGYYSLSRNKGAKPIVGVIIYRFSGNLFFANIDTFVEDIEGAVKEDTKGVIVDARGISSIDITAADRMVILRNELKNKGISFYMTEHAGNLNDQLRKFGAGCLIDEGCVRRTMSLALRDMGIDKPYPIEGAENRAKPEYVEAGERLAEFEWAFGMDAQEHLRDIAKEIADHLNSDKDTTLDDAERELSFGKIGYFDEEEMLDYLEQYILEQDIQQESDKEHHILLAKQIEKRREFVEKKLLEINPHALEILRERRKKIREKIKEDLSIDR